VKVLKHKNKQNDAQESEKKILTCEMQEFGRINIQYWFEFGTAGEEVNECINSGCDLQYFVTQSGRGRGSSHSCG
jgi:hypothetical protein